MEWLMIGGVLAFLLLGSGLALTAARERVRDYKRLTDMTRIQAALELYFNEQNQYPVTTEPLSLGGEVARCLSRSGFEASCPPSGRIFLSPVPVPTSIGIPDAQAVYLYQSNGETYSVTFVVERSIPQANVAKGVVCAYPGVAVRQAVSGACPL